MKLEIGHNKQTVLLIGKAVLITKRSLVKLLSEQMNRVQGSFPFLLSKSTAIFGGYILD